jgi:hypothetical protein
MPRNRVQTDETANTLVVDVTVSGDYFRLRFPRGSSRAYPLSSLRQQRRYYRRLAQLHSHPSYDAIAIALEKLNL